MGNLKVGAAKIDITPPLGCDMAGYAGRDSGSETIADPLYAKALVFDDGDTQAAIITTRSDWRRGGICRSRSPRSRGERRGFRLAT